MVGGTLDQARLTSASTDLRSEFAKPRSFSQASRLLDVTTGSCGAWGAALCLEGTSMLVKLRSACALFALVGGCSSEEATDSTQGGLTFPAPGESRTIGFELDAADQPIARGTYI